MDRYFSGLYKTDRQVKDKYLDGYVDVRIDIQLCRLIDFLIIYTKQVDICKTRYLAIQTDRYFSDLYNKIHR